MVELLAKRIPIERLFEHPRLAEELALASGGHVRTLIRNLLIGAASNGLSATKEHVQLVIAQLREQFESSIRPEAVPALEAIRRTGTLKSVEAKDLPLLARHMSAQLVLCYRNGDGWYEVNPLVRDDVRLRAEQMAASTAIQSPESQ